jgi:hypothetical protein
LVESVFGDTRNPTPTATPYRNGVPIDSIAPSTDADDFLLEFVEKKLIKVSLVVLVG